MSATRRSWKFDDVCTAIPTSFPGAPPIRWSHGTPSVWTNRKRVEDETQDHVEFGDDAEFESEIEAIVGALEPTEESDATEVLATWKQTRTAMAHSRTVRQSPKTLRNQISRGWRVALGAVIVERLAISVGIVRRNASKHREMTLASFHANWSSRRLPTSS